MEELAPADKVTVFRARKLQRFLSQPMFVAKVYTGIKGRYVPLKDTIASFKTILNGDVDDLPEQAFLNVGTIEEAKRKASVILEQAKQ